MNPKEVIWNNIFLLRSDTRKFVYRPDFCIMLELAQYTYRCAPEKKSPWKYATEIEKDFFLWTAFLQKDGTDVLREAYPDQ